MTEHCVSKADIRRLCELLKESQMKLDFQKFADSKAMEKKSNEKERRAELKEQARKAG